MKTYKNIINNHFYPQKKKKFGQHFLRKQSVVDNMINKVKIGATTYILEIGCGDGFLTESILQQTQCNELWSYEIDPEWAEIVKNKITDPRLKIKQENVLDVNFKELQKFKPWIILANLPYQITFPLFFLFQKNKNLFSEGVVMIQEEVAQKIVATKGKGYGVTSIFLQHHFDFELLEKIEPGSFNPPPKIFSRLIYFKPKEKVTLIPEEESFWKFLKLCFLFPRRTLRNNIKTTHHTLEKIPSKLLSKRAQELNFHDFLELWNKIILFETSN
ncbi:16S rRNA (adenine(1518)-N(6)/adenine(1519)-N(6))-dimethyltransferase RsmA [Candidatus Dependentiae bacterium]